MQSEVIAARMTPVGEVFERFPRLVRDLARDLGKRIRFDMEGEEIELDRSMLDEIGEPLLHLIRNAADHGIEPPRRAVAAGKPAEGRILLGRARAEQRGPRGERRRPRDRPRGHPGQGAARRLDRAGSDRLTDDLLLRVLARPGFSTAESVSGVSGRGVGVDVAVTRVRALGGTTRGAERGPRDHLHHRVPLTLAIVRALLASAAASATRSRSPTWRRPWSSTPTVTAMRDARRSWCATGDSDGAPRDLVGRPARRGRAARRP